MRKALVLAAFLAGAAQAETVDLTIEGPAGLLAGTLETSNGPQAALILPGSGPTDRNGNQPAMGLLADSHRLLAEALADGGLPTLRIDKRGIGGSGGDPNAVSLAVWQPPSAAQWAGLTALGLSMAAAQGCFVNAWRAPMPAS